MLLNLPKLFITDRGWCPHRKDELPADRSACGQKMRFVQASNCGIVALSRSSVSLSPARPCQSKDNRSCWRCSGPHQPSLPRDSTTTPVSARRGPCARKSMRLPRKGDGTLRSLPSYKAKNVREVNSTACSVGSEFLAAR